ncbi:RNA-protein complex protein Nop10 [Candidatus Woesearchaeota archaeon]|nr:RNA-protein complex protein Nop10 [Candidatus Woesearchaeota archaeon]
MKQLMRCMSCSRYTLQKECPQCRAQTQVPLPPKFSPIDKYASYRRTAKSGQRKAQGIL